ncbi:Cell 12A endoglucanase [Phytophthora nicotianae]|uniref:Cell 12A endoglucanase n=1 Tax=Phytophthora nicotianae TaxID=4792 RepID=A0A0W8DGC1_PHYNI|nr:Cell 12A endoglucanase [Phytophthora nicotianae]
MAEVDSLVSDLLQVRKLFANNHLSDVLFIFTSDSGGSPASDGGENDKSSTAGDHLIPAHRLVLSLRSGAFQTALLKAKSSQVPGQVRFPLKIHVQDTPYRVFYSLLRFLYTNDLGAGGRWRQARPRGILATAAASSVRISGSIVVDICVKRIASFLELESDKVEEEKVEECEDAEERKRRLQKKTLDVLVFMDTVLATYPLTARRREPSDSHTITPPPSQNGRRSTGDGSDAGSSVLSRCAEAVCQLQSMCLKQLQHMDEAAFEELLQSDTGRQCSTERLCEILRMRSDTPLVVAIRYQLGRVVNELLLLGEPLDQVGGDEIDLPLVAALKTGNNAIIRRLLVDESAPFFLLTDKVPLIFLASASGNVQHCDILIEQNAADVNLISQLKDGDKEITAEFGHQQTPLHIACRKGHSAVAELLLQHNAASNLPDEEGNTALHYASNIETVEVLLNSAFRTNANIPNRRGRTPLHIAAARGDVAVVAYLIRHGAEQDIVDDQGQNAFHHAAANGHTAVTLVLLHENEAAMANAKKLVITSESNGTTENTHSEDSQQMKQTGGGEIDSAEENGEKREEPNGFDINREDLKGNTALHLAAMSPSERCQKMLQLLLENGADPNRANWFGYTALHLLCSHQNGPASLINAFEFLVAGTPINECCARGDELELGVTVPAHGATHVDATPSVAVSSVSGVDSDGETSEFCVLFHKLPLGFTMKRGHDSSTEVGTIYPKSAATHFPRLTPGVTIVSIAGTPLEDMGLRQVHDLIKNAGLPLEIHFRGPELMVPPSSPNPAQQQQERLSASAVIPPPHPQQQGRRRRGSFDRRSVRSNGSNGSGRSRNSRGSRGRKKGDSTEHKGADNQQKGEGGKTRIQAAGHRDASDSNQRSGPEEHDADHNTEADLVEQIEQLKVALLRKHEEAKQIARLLETCSEKLLALRGESGGMATSHQQQQRQQPKQNGTPRSRRSGAPPSNNGGSKVRLTPEVLEAMDQKAGLPRRGTGAYASSNVSSVSGYSAQSMPVARSGSMRARNARAAALANADNVSVSSYTSNSSNTSARRGGNHLNKRYNYIPQKYATSTTGTSEAGSTSLSSRGAVMSRARISRDSFITKSESPGVGYYDVQVKDRVKGGEIGDSDRSLPWS